MQAQKNGVALDEEQLLFIVADDCDAFDSDVDEAPTAQTMFMANLSSADHVYDEASPSYDSDILSEVHDNDHYQDAVCEHHEVHEMHDDVQPNYGVDSHTDYTSDSNMIPYDQYVKDNVVLVVQSNVSSVLNDAYMMILNDIYELRAKFELTEREQKINEQLKIVIADRNRKEEILKRELHYVKLQVTPTINHNKSMVEEVTLLNAAYKKPLNLLKKGLLIRGEAVEASKRRRSLLDHKIQQLSKGSTEGSGIILEVLDEPKDNSEKQSGNVQTSLTLSSAKLEIQSVVDVPIHQEDPTV
ncbi:hypothetical protein Tco_1301622 [Tanacetum coccineum]